MNSTMRTVLKVVTIVLSVAAAVAAVFGVIHYLTQGEGKKYTNFPSEFDDYEDWEPSF